MEAIEPAFEQAPLTPAVIATMPDVAFGEAMISPARRVVTGPGGRADVEPRVMLVLVCLLQSAGQVVTRDTLFERCWGGVPVGDDSLNRTIAAIRRICTEIAAGSFAVETIPRTGYRLTTGAEASGVAPQSWVGGAETPDHRLSRRGAVAGGLVLAGAAGAGVLWLDRRIDPRVTASLDRGRAILREAMPGSYAAAATEFRRAVAIDPAHAPAWGLLAITYRHLAETGPPSGTAQAVVACEAAAKRALALDRREGNALAALATLRPELGNWIETEDKLRHVLEVAPDNPWGLSYLVMLLQSVGRAHESWALNERAAALDQLSPVPQFRKGLKLWIFGRVGEADLVIDRALQLWPRHPAVWSARLYIFAFTGRAEAAMAMIEDSGARPNRFTGPSLDMWRKSLLALATRAPAEIAAARQANIAAAPLSPGFAVWAIMTLAHLGELDSAFAVANGSLLRRGPLIGTLWTGRGELPINDNYWRRTMNLFTPATRAMRADSRFRTLCDGIGLSEYWRQRRGPDPFLRAV